MGVVKAVEWQAVDSGVFAFAAYRPEARQLYLRFKNGGIYRYFDCPAKVYEAFLAAESKGRYFSRCSSEPYALIGYITSDDCTLFIER